MVNNHYKSNLRDIFFNLFNFLDIKNTILKGNSIFTQQEAVIKDILITFDEFCAKKIAPSFKEGDNVSLRLDIDGNVFLPDGIKKAINAFYDGDWHLIDVSEHIGGFNFPKSVYWSFFEILSGSNPPVALYTFGSYGSEIIESLGTESQKNRFSRNMIERKWAASMALTEPDSGSDLGTIQTKAFHVRNDIWKIEGIKRFITNGDFDAAENIIHFVLARPSGAGDGTNGLSLFIVPKYWVNTSGEIEEKNGVLCKKLEKKMGIKASATCELSFGENREAFGFLLGNIHNGMRQVFHLIERARMAVGVKSMSVLSSAYLNSLEYCKTRVQGVDLLNIGNKKAKKVTIINHPDIRRMLMFQKAYSEGMRALCLYCAFIQDELSIRYSPQNKSLAELLLPLIKGYNSEKTYEVLSLSLQCYGGSGYISDYPIEQYIRDQKIDSLYEGTTHIQALDLIFRKIIKNNGATLQILFQQIREMLHIRLANDILFEEYDLMNEALENAEQILLLMIDKIGESIHYIGLYGNKILFSMAELIIAWLMLRQSEVAIQQLALLPVNNLNLDKNFYEGKISSAKFFCREALPNLFLTKLAIKKSNLYLMELSSEAF